MHLEMNINWSTGNDVLLLLSQFVQHKLEVCWGSLRCLLGGFGDCLFDMTADYLKTDDFWVGCC